MHLMLQVVIFFCFFLKMNKIGFKIQSTVYVICLRQTTILGITVQIYGNCQSGIKNV